MMKTSNRYKNKYEKFSHLSRFVIKSYLLGLLILMTFRIVFIFYFGNLQELSAFKTDIFQSFITGFRFDTVVLTYSLLIIFIISFLSFLLPLNNKHINKFINYTFLIYGIFVISILIIISFVDVYHYKFFNSHINVSAFGIIDDDTKALFKSIWIDYPVIKITIGIILLISALSFILRKMISVKNQISIKSNYFKYSYIFLYITLYGLGMRCSFGNVPLEFMEASISENSFINNIPHNGAFALKNAFEEGFDSKISTDINNLLKEFGYKNVNEAYTDYFDKIPPKDYNILEVFKAKSAKSDFLEDNPPNVIFIMMESMGNAFFNQHTKGFNTLGQLEIELPHCTVFKNFFPARNLTIFTLESLLINSPQSPMSQSKYLNTYFSESSAIKPFINAGYNTTYVTGGRAAWRNLNNFLPLQGFHAFEDGASIKKHIPEATVEHEWGVFDEYLFERMFQILSENRTKPQFVFAMTISNHTPYKVPSSYTGFPLENISKLEKQVNNIDKYVLDNFLCFQYSNHYLGKFIEKIRNSEFADNTIIVATGDHASHNTGNFFKYSDKNLYHRYSVPAIFYIPEKYKDNLNINPDIFGSHKDIFPTLYELSLSDVEYFKGGNNLFEENKTLQNFSLFNYNTLFSKDGCVRFNNNPVYFKWSDKVKKELSYSVENSKLKEQYKKAKALSFLLNYQIIKQCTDKH